MSVHFRWEAHEFHRLLASCHSDDAAPYILRYIEKQGPILEVGCGLGRFVAFMEQQGFQDVRGIDISADAVDIVYKMAPNLNVTHGDVSKLPFEDSSIRGVVSLGVVEHFQDGPQAALREIERVMMPGATAIITVPYLNLVRRFKHAARIYEMSDRIRAMRARASTTNVREDVVGRSIAELDREKFLSEGNSSYQFPRWPTKGPFFEYRFSLRQFEEELLSVGLSILEEAPIDAVSGMFYEFGAPFVRSSTTGQRVLTRLGHTFNWTLSRASWIHAHMLLFAVHKDEMA
jgi:SAM-dependent methyltransferase